MISIILNFALAIILGTNPISHPLELENKQKVIFFEGSLTEAKAVAGEQGKLTLVDFYASWCKPCKWMEENTFTNEQVIDLMKDNVVPVKINIDDFDGYAWKEQLKVSALPTIIIFNSEGQEIFRANKTVSASEMVNVINRYNTTENKKITKRMINRAPRNLTNSKLKAVSKYSSKASYKLQVGIYDDYADALLSFNNLQNQFEEPIIVLNDYKNGSTRFKIMLGEFESEAEAEELKHRLMIDHHIDAEIK